MLNAVHFFFIPAVLHIFYLFWAFCTVSLRKFVALLQPILSLCAAQNMNKKNRGMPKAFLCFAFCGFYGGLRWVVGGKIRGIPATPHPLRGSSPRRGAFGGAPPYIVAPIKGSPACRKASLCETDSPDTGEVAQSARRGAVPRGGGGREPCHSPKYFGQPYNSLPHRLRAEPPRRGGQGVNAPLSSP